MPGKRVERLQIMLSDEELAAIDEWRFRHRMPSRSAAVRAMLNVAIRKEPAPAAEEIPFGEVAPSRDVGVLAPPPGAGGASGHGQRVVVIEPSRVAAAGIASLLEQAGHDVIAMLTGPQNWKETLPGSLPDCAVIGDGLEPEVASQMADELVRRGIPYVYFKARPEKPMPDRFRDVPAIHAGANAEEFNASLERICRS